MPIIRSLSHLHLHTLTVLFLLALTLMLPPQTSAQADCRQTPDYFGSFYQLLFNNEHEDLTQVDCSVYPEGTPLMDDFINNAVVSCVDRPELIAQLIGDEQYIDYIARTGSGEARVNLEENANFSIDSETLETNYQALNPYLLATSMSWQVDESGVLSDCAAAGFDSYDECAQSKGVALYSSQGNYYKNRFATSTQSQRTTNIPGMLKARYDRAQHILRCTSSTPPADEHCDNYYCLDTNGTTCETTSIEVANFIVDNLRPDYLVEDFLALEGTEFEGYDAQNIILSLEDSKATQTFYLVIIPAIRDDADLSFFEWLSYLIKGYLDPLKPIYIRGTLPAVPQIEKSHYDTVKKYNTLTKGQEAVSEIETSTYNPVDNSQSHRNQLLQKIDQSGVTCELPLPPNQFLGGVSDSRPDTDITWDWFFDILTSPQEARDDTMFTYEGYLIEPGENARVKDLQGPHERSIQKKFYLTNYQAGFTQEVDIKQPINDEGQDPTASTNMSSPVVVDQYPCEINIQTRVCECLPGDSGPDSNGICRQLETVGFVYQDAQESSAGLSGGEYAHNRRLSTDHKRFAQAETNRYFETQCYYDEMAAKLATKGIDIAALLNITNTRFIDPSQCPDSLKQGSNVPASPRTPASGDICAIAARYNMPCCILQGIQLIESGCNPDTSGTNTCGNFSCCNSGCYCGPMQIGAGLYDYLRAGENLDMCSLEGSAELAARLLIRKKCQAWGNLCDRGLLSGQECDLASKYSCTDSYTWDPNMLNEPLLQIGSSDYDVLGYYYGTCEPEPSTIGRGWGDKGYCDMIQHYCNGGTIPGLEACT